MFPLIWMILLFTERSSFVNTVASPGDSPGISAEAGLCAVIPCNLTADTDFTFESAAWYKCEQNCTDSGIKLRLNNTDSNAQPGSGGRVSLLERNNCSIIINDLTRSDSGSYQLSVLNETMQRLTFQSATITVQDLIQKPTVMIPALTEGQQTTLTCTAPGLCSGSDPTITWTWSGSREKSSHITGNITEFQTEKVTSVTQRHSSTLTFNPSAEHHGTSVTCKVSFIDNITTEETVTLNVIYIKKPEITGRTTLNQGDTLNLTCSAESFPPASVIWTPVSSNKDLHSANEEEKQQKNTGTATLVYPSVTTEHGGQYTCTAKHQTTTLTVDANVTVTLYPKILNSSGCINQSEFLACMCISRGSPLPTIKWPLLQNHSKYSVSSTVSNDTINSTIVLTVKEQSDTGVECVSRNPNGEVKEILIVKKVEKDDEGQIRKFFRIVSLEIIIAFLIGVLLSAVTCCFVRKCHRNKRRTYGNQADTLEMVTILEDQMISGPAAEGDRTIYQDTAEAGEAGAVGKSEVEYSHLDFSLIKRQTPAEAGATQGKAETEYAEIKREKVKARPEGESKVEEEVIEKDEEAEHGAREEEESEDVAVYSTVKDVMDQIEGELTVS